MHYSIINTLCSTYFSKEDGFFMEKLRDKFEETRREISLGQDIVTEFIIFVKIVGSFLQLSGKELAGKWGKELLEREKCFFLYSSFMERYLSFICSLDIIDEIPMTTMYNLFKTNLAKAEMLTYVYVFNAPSWSEKLDFVWGKTDLQQRNVSMILFFDIAKLSSSMQLLLQLNWDRLLIIF